MTQEKENIGEGSYADSIITLEYLRTHRDHIFVFGDNILHTGKGGAAYLRDEPNTYGFITKKFPNNNDGSFFKPHEYRVVYQEEMIAFKGHIKNHPNQTFLISKLGAGLANRYNIFEQVIRPQIKADLKEFTNVRFLW